MVALLGLLDLSEFRVEVGLVLADDAVDALEHLVLLVAAVVAAGHLHELDRANLRAVLDVRADAHFEIVAHRVGADRLAGGGDVRQTLELVLLAGKLRRNLVLRHVGLHERLVERNQARDLLLNGREILGSETVLEIKIIVEAVIRGGTDIRQGARVQIAHGPRHEMGGRVTAHFFGNVHFSYLLLESLYDTPVWDR